jgi:small conductance mechanosensitive channel
MSLLVSIKEWMMVRNQRWLAPAILVCSFVAAISGSSVSCCAQAENPILLNTKRLEDAPVVQEAKATFDQVMRGDFSNVGPMLEGYLIPALIALVLIVVGYLAATAVGRIAGTAIANKVDMTLGRFLGKLVTNGILVLVFLGVLGRFGIDVTGFAALLAASGFAIGLALQGALSNFAAGIMLLVFRPFKVNDLVKIGDSKGFVHEIDLFTTRLNTVENRHLILPNNEVFGSVIENFSHNRTRRVDVSVGVAYAADMRQTRKVLQGAVSVVPGAVADPAPRIVLVELGDSSVNWEVRVWTRPENFLDVQEFVTGAVKEALDAANISIPFPQLDLHVIGQVPQLKAA